MSYNYTPQMIFDKVWNHFVARRAPFSYDRNTGCTYRNAQGVRCAVGLFIEKRDYRPEMETMPLGLLCTHYGNAMGRFLRDNESLLLRLQCAHDYAAVAWDYAGFERSLRGIAASCGLRIPGETP